jgi:biopolymer transport protein ExbD
MIRFQKDDKRLLMSEINIIPFTDIVLVILIIFIITTPILIQSSIKVNLPQTQLNSPITPADEINITVNADSEVFINDVKVDSVKEYKRILREIQVDKKSVIIKADRSAKYGFIANLLGIAQDFGAKKLQLLVENKPDEL